MDKVGLIHSTTKTVGLNVLEKVIKTCSEMLSDRGCTNIEITNDILESMEEVTQILKGRGAKQIDVFFYNEERVGVKFLRNLLEESSIDLIIIVSLDGPTTFTKKEAENIPVQFFTFKDLCVNITKHRIVPKHELCTEQINWSVKELPKIPEFDPIVQYYNFPVGSIIKISRTFGSHEPTIYYRHVISS